MLTLKIFSLLTTNIFRKYNYFLNNQLIFVENLFYQLTNHLKSINLATSKNLKYLSLFNNAELKNVILYKKLSKKNA
jgi:hypothetical protein